MEWIFGVLFLLLLIVGIAFLIKILINHRDRSYLNKFSSSSPVRNSVTSSNNLSTQKNEYKIKDSLMTDTEKRYFQGIRSILPDSYIVQPQINLATVLDKVSGSYYQNELFRNIDFGIFDLDYKPLLLIEINDETHREPERVKRDAKVANICFDAGLPLIRFWTSYGVDTDYMLKRLRQDLDFQPLN